MKKPFLIFCLFCLFTTVTAFSSKAPTATKLDGELKNKQLILKWNIYHGFLLYRNSIELRIVEPSPLKLGKFKRPPGIKKHDKILGHYQVYEKQLTLRVPIEQYQPSEARIIIEFQTCSSTGICYPPQSRLMTIQITKFSGWVQSITTIPYRATDFSKD